MYELNSYTFTVGYRLQCRELIVECVNILKRISVKFPLLAGNETNNNYKCLSTFKIKIQH